MRKASMILGIIGGVIAIVIGLFSLGGSVLFTNVMPEVMESEEFAEAYNEQLPEDYPADMVQPDEVMGMVGSLYMGVGIAIILSGILGIVGGALVKKNNILAGILMLVGAVISLFTVVAILAFILMLLGGIFAFVKDKSAQQVQNIPSEV